MKNKVFLLITDLIFKSKIKASHFYSPEVVTFIKNMSELKTNLDEHLVELCVVDLNVDIFRTSDLVTTIKGKNKNCIILGFYSHVQTEIAKEALSLGFDKVMPRSKFFEELGQIIDPVSS